ncbi:nucleic acid-binding, OB-fold protein [Artemisia annua]|uniref:Nucleic acid-binding, OB-fold protein n=1 Tax=Artemisia annua TaxID=35608 RepID=A0A2U1PQP8_ARTAN|nr:nucleic acid-binding, OB-fold protein [Artemisia annua]
MSKQQKKHSPGYTLDQLKEGDEGLIVVMICRKWDVHDINGRYLSTNVVVSDAKGITFHCEARIMHVRTNNWYYPVKVLLDGLEEAEDDALLLPHALLNL